MSFNPYSKERTVGYIRDDIRYMSYEVRIAEGHMAAPERKRTAPAVTTCFCGKTVTHTHGVPVRLDGREVTCPRECEKERRA